MGKEAVAYEISFDQATIQKEPNAGKYIRKQIETHLGERFNTLLSTFNFEIKDGQIYGEDTQEPFLESIKRGRNYRKMNGNKIDRRREDAEVTGFETIQNILTDPNTELGTIMLSVSPRGEEGSTYIHNFYDIFILSGNEKGRFIEGRRYSSALSPMETVRRLQEEFNSPKLPFPNDVSFLANPIKMQGITANQIHGCLHKKHDYMNPSNFHHLRTAIRPMIDAYEQALLEGNQVFIETSYDAILNVADKILEDLMKTENKQKMVSEVLAKGIPNRSYIEAIGRQPVRQIMTGCGSSGGSKKEKNFAFSVSEFGIKGRGYDFDQKGPCSQCGRDVPCGPCKICESCVENIESSE